MNLKVFYHIVDLPGWKDITDEQLSDMKVSGLLDIAEVYINCNYNESSFDSLREEWKDYSNIKWIFQNNLKEDFEHPTWLLFQDAANTSETEFYGLYLHQKGITHRGTHRAIPTKHWRWVMNYWNIIKWRDCIAKLEEGYDAVGCLLHPIFVPPIFMGSFHWTRSSFVKKSKQLVLPSTIGYASQHIPNHPLYRCDIEGWHSWNNAKMGTVYNVSGEWYNHDFYNQEFPPIKEIYEGIYGKNN